MKSPASFNIAIQPWPGSFSDRWIEYCVAHGIRHTLVDCYRNDIVEQVKRCDGLMWHWDQKDYKAILFARQLTYSLEAAGVPVFPDSRTCWHFDDKVGQKYLLEAVGARLVPSYAFYDRQRAAEWIEAATFPKVFKLRVGSASSNVQLVTSKAQARTLCQRAFGQGFKPVAGYFSDARKKGRGVKTMGSFFRKLKGLPSSVARIREANRLMAAERGYIYFQDFVPGNAYDTRIIVVGDKAIGVRRYVRKDDFRASGSGSLEYARESIDERCVADAFDLSARLRTQSLACDYVSDGGEARLLEISYGFVPRFYDDCPGYWDRAMAWHEGVAAVEDLIIEMFLGQLTAAPR
jgi:glutathione synthase/RimK-type ligase-like ATP-grasp enzyme